MEESNRKSARTRVFLLSGLVFLAAAGAVLYYYWTKDQVSTDDAFVDGRIFSITPRVAGYVTEVLVSDNQEVKKGQPLVTLDPSEYKVALAEAQAALAEAQATLISLELGVPLELTQTAHRVEGAEAELESLKQNLLMAQNEQEAADQDFRRTKAEHDQVQLDLGRYRVLRKSGAIPQSALDELQTRFRTTRAQLEAAKAKWEAARKRRASVERDLGRLRANIKLAATGGDLALIKARQVEAQKARVELTQAKLRQAELDLGYTTLTSPTHGYVSRKKIEPGQMVSRGQPLMAVVPLDPPEIWITANFKETQLTKVHPGLPVSIKVDTYPGLTLSGRVESLTAGTGSVFSLFPPENASGNFVKVVQRIPVKIVLEKNGSDPLPVLRLGMSVIPTIFTDK